MKTTYVLMAGVFGLINAPAFAQENNRPSLSLPLDCTIGKDCWLQNLVDVEMKDGKWRDPYCGLATFDKHKGTDIRVSSIMDMERGIPILAMADGIVRGGRSNMADHLVENAQDVAKIQGKQCGNGAIIEHAGNWTTQYCHLRKDTVTVKAGQRIKRGDVIGLMGLSGHTTFPHIHVTVRKGKTVMDPMTGLAQSNSCSVDAEISKASLWSEEARKDMNTKTAALVFSGFASTPVKRRQSLFGRIPKPALKKPLVFFATFINLQKGDRINLSIHGPDGVYVQSRGKPLPVPQATYTAFTGRKRGPKKGSSYRGTATLFRNGQEVFSIDSKLLKF